MSYNDYPHSWFGLATLKSDSKKFRDLLSSVNKRLRPSLSHLIPVIDILVSQGSYNAVNLIIDEMNNGLRNFRNYYSEKIMWNRYIIYYCINASLSDKQ